MQVLINEKRAVIAITVTYIIFNNFFTKKIQISKFNLKEIKVENNIILENKDLKKLLIPSYDKNLIF